MVKISKNAMEVLKRRYLLKDKKGKVIESPVQMFKRIAKFIAKNKTQEEEFFKILSNLDFLPNSPTLMNANTRIGQLSACFVLDIEDSLDSIFENVKISALIQQSGGGVGYSFSKLRPKGDIVGSTKGVASGPVSFMNVFNEATNVIKQGGKRRGANMAVLSVTHPDVEEFITAKRDPAKLTNFNLSVAVTNKFMKAVEKNKSFSLMHPKTNKVVKKVNAKKLFNLIAESAWRTGDPGLIFIDEINKHNPSKQKIEATNPCVTKDTLINSSEGLIKIEKMHNPFSVVSSDNNLHKISWAGKTGIKDVYKIKTEAGYELKATADHKIMTTKGWKAVKDLTNKDKLVIKQGTFGKVHLNKKLAPMLGWLIGDGYITKNKQDIGFSFNINEKLELLPKFKNYLDKINKGPVKPTIRGNQVSLKYSSKIAKKFYDLGIKPVEADKKEVPEIIFESDKNTVASFLSALFSADGSVQGTTKKGVSIRLASNSSNLLKQVQLLLLQFNVLSKVYENRRKEGYKSLPDSQRKSKKYFCKAQHELIISRKSMFNFMEEIGFCLKSKNLKFKAVKPDEIYEDNVNTSIRSVSYVGKEEVYDLTEPVNHTFIANGILVHNCGEQPLLPFESCNLGSINLSHMIKNKKIDWDKLKKTIYLAVQFLDNVIDKNKYLIPKIEDMTKANRRIGLGVMGFADCLIKLNIPYNSKEAVKTAEDIMKFINEESHKESERLANKYGAFPNFKKTNLKKARRNIAVTTIAPTGTISMIANCSSGIEPLFGIIYEREILDHTKFIEVNPLFYRYYTPSKRETRIIAQTGSIQKIQSIPKKIKDIFITALDIKPEYHVKIQAAFQKYTDNAVSKTVNLPGRASKEDVEKIFKLAYKLKCKGITLYRYGSKPEQVLKVASDYSGGCPEPTCPH